MLTSISEEEEGNLAVAQKENPAGDHRWLGLLFL